MTQWLISYHCLCFSAMLRIYAMLLMLILSVHLCLRVPAVRMCLCVPCMRDWQEASYCSTVSDNEEVTR